MATCSKLPKLLVSSFYAEAADVYKGGNCVGDSNIGCQDLDIVFADKDPDGKLGALGCSSSCKSGQGNCVGVEGCNDI